LRRFVMRTPIPLALSLLLSAGCGPKDETSWPSHASSYLQDGQFGVLVYVRDEAHTLVGVRVKGPGMADYGGNFQYGPPGASGHWVGSVPLGTMHPPPPLSYEVELWDGAKTRFATVVVTCFLDTAPVILAPLADAVVTSPVTFQWTAVPDAGVRYVMGVTENHVVEGKTSITLPLAPGVYDWWLEAERMEGNDRLCWSRAEQGPFSVAACGSGILYQQRLPVAGLSIVETSPLQVTLVPNPSLIDGNTALSAGVDLGYGPTLEGDSRLRDMGVELADAVTAVDELHVWVDRALPPEVSVSYLWSAYRSVDNLSWIPIPLRAPVRFGVFHSRFEIPIVRTQERYFKAVTRPLAPGITSDPAYAAVLVTELQAFAVEALPPCATGSAIAPE
jgi:hypothetical protein